MAQRIRDAVSGELTLDYFMRRSAEGWRLAAVEWVRAADAQQAAEPVAIAGALPETSPTPYGLRVVEGSPFLEQNPLEATVLLLILEQIVHEKRVSEIAHDLNRRGYSTRSGKPWGATDVFDLLPRLIEAGPALLKSAAWQERRQTGAPAARPPV